jgi:hypothetical protein
VVAAKEKGVIVPKPTNPLLGARDDKSAAATPRGMRSTHSLRTTPRQSTVPSTPALMDTEVKELSCPLPCLVLCLVLCLVCLALYFALPCTLPCRALPCLD